MMKSFYDSGLNFSCSGCSYCCRFEGGVVFLSDDDLKRLADFENLTEEQFIQVYCRHVTDDSGDTYLVLKTLASGDCIFWNKDLFEGKGGCECYEARPVQCSTYPFWSRIMESEETWNAEKKCCPGINCGGKVDCEKIRRELSKYEENKKHVIKK